MMQYRREIDGLRSLAVIPVILFHAGSSIFKGGYVGVDVFFVISGYLITSIILSETVNGTFSLINFYERRVRRILPALFVVMLSSIAFALLWLSPYDMQEFARSIKYISLFISNILFYRQSGYFDTESELKPLLHTWTLSLEEQYYIIFPLVLMMVWKFAKNFLPHAFFFIATISLLYADHAVRINPDAAFFLLPSRIWEFMIGAYLAYLVVLKNIQPVANQFLGFLGLLLLLYSIFEFSDATPHPSFHTIIPTFGTALIIMYATKTTIVGRILGNPIPVGIGLISYSAYLWHQPIFALYRHQSFTEPSKLTLGYLTALTFALAYVTWRFVEQPFRRREFINRKQIFTLAFIGSIFFILFGFLGKQTSGFAQRFAPDVLVPINKAIESKKGRSKCWDILNVESSLNDVCKLGSKSASTSFAIVGDSHAGSLSPALDDLALQTNISGKDFTYRACSIVSGNKNNSSGEKNTVCGRLREDIMANLNTPNIPEILILSQRWANLIESTPFDNGEGGFEKLPAQAKRGNPANNNNKLAKMHYVTSTINQFVASGKTIVIIYPIPEMGWSVTKRLLRIFSLNKKIAKEDASTSHEIFKKRNKNAYLALDAVGKHKNLIRIYPEQIFCNTYVAGRCVAHVDGSPLYYDDDHLSRFGATLISKEIGEKLNWQKSVN